MSRARTVANYGDGLEAADIPNIDASKITSGGLVTAVTTATFSSVGSMPLYCARAWICFDGTAGSIGTGKSSGNISSVTDNGSGDYTIVFDVDFSNTDYCGIESTHGGVAAGYREAFMFGTGDPDNYSKLVGSCKILSCRTTSSTTYTLLDSTDVMCAFFAIT